MNNTIQEVSVDLHDWRDEQEAWNNRSKFFVELHNRADRKAQVTDLIRCASCLAAREADATRAPRRE